MKPLLPGFFLLLAACAATPPEPANTSSTHTPTTSGSVAEAPPVNLTQAAYQNKVLADKPNLYLILNEGAGVDAEDSSNHGFFGDNIFDNPSVSGGPFATTIAPVFNGSTNRFIVANNALLQLSSYTIELWFRVSGTSSNGIYNSLIAKGNNTGYGREENYAMMVHNTSGVLIGRVGLTSSAPELTSTQAVNDGKWHHAAFSVLRTIQNPGETPKLTLTLYLDGSAVATSILFGEPMSNAIGPLAVGCWMTNSSTVYGAMNGQISNVAVYPEALTTKQIANHLQP